MKIFENWAPALIPPPHFKPDKELGRLEEGDRDTFYPGLYILLFAIPATKKSCGPGFVRCNSASLLSASAHTNLHRVVPMETPKGEFQHAYA